MRKLALGAMLLGCGLFLTGCNDTAKQKDVSKRTVSTDQQTGETKVKEEEKHTQTNSDTGAKTEISVDKEATIKPAQENGDNDSATDNNPPADNTNDANSTAPEPK